jgi:hypothetical protein
MESGMILAFPYRMLYLMRMTRTANPRFVADVRLVIDIAGTDEIDAEARLDAVCDFLRERLGRSTFERLSGKPRVELVDIISDVVPS